jgi:hypothetical protein
MPEWLTPIIIAVVSGSLVIIGNLIATAVRRSRSDPPTWPEMWERIKSLEADVRQLHQAQEVSERRWVSAIVTVLDKIPNTEVVELHPDDYEFVREALPAYHLARLRARQA